jgi:hypothetical protein
MDATLKGLAATLSAAPAYAVIPVPSLPVFAEEFHLPASVDSEHLRNAISSGLQIILAAPITPSDNPAATDLNPFAVRAEVFFRGPEQGGKVATVFETGQRVSVRYSETDNGIRASVRPDDYWSLS